MTEPDVIRALLLSSPTSVAGSLMSFEELPHAGSRRIAFAFSHGSRFCSSYIVFSHLVTADGGVPRAYTRWPQANHPGEPDQAIRLDRWLEDARGRHPRYTRLDNTGRGWAAKSWEARAHCS